MTLDCAVALSLVPDLPRPGLTDRLKAADPLLLACAGPLLVEARRVRSRAAAAGMQVLPWNDPRYPAALLAISDCPPALWYRGELDALARPAVAIVGSRAASPVALETAERLAADLARQGVLVVSGLARGVDSAAHRGALGTGLTAAVLGSGLDRIYPPEHRTLAERIAAAGLVLSEFPPGTAPLPFRFPMRNRLISGLSRAVVVIEASASSGSLITASCAVEQGRDVMAVPGNVLSGRNRGGHALIRDGAAIVECAGDVLEELGLPEPGHGAVQGTTRRHAPAPADPLLRCMASGHEYDLDALAGASGMAVSRLLPHLMDLELRGLIRRLDGGRFMRLS